MLFRVTFANREEEDTMLYTNMLEHRFAELVPVDYSVLKKAEDAVHDGIYLFYPERHNPNPITGDFSAVLRLNGCFAARFIELNLGYSDVAAFFGNSMTHFEYEQGHRKRTSIEIGVRITEFDSFLAAARIEEKFDIVGKHLVKIVAIRRTHDNKCYPVLIWHLH